MVAEHTEPPRCAAAGLAHMSAAIARPAIAAVLAHTPPSVERLLRGLLDRRLPPNVGPGAGMVARLHAAPGARGPGWAGSARWDQRGLHYLVGMDRLAILLPLRSCCPAPAPRVREAAGGNCGPPKVTTPASVGRRAGSARRQAIAGLTCERNAFFAPDRRGGSNGTVVLTLTAPAASSVTCAFQRQRLARCGPPPAPPGPRRPPRRRPPGPRARTA